MSRNRWPSHSIAVTSRHRHITEVFETMAQDLGPFVDDRMRTYFSDESSWLDAAANRMGRPTEHGTTDPLFQLLVLQRFWGPVFAEHYGKDLRPLIKKLVIARNQWAHFSLPEDLESLDEYVLAAERIVAPVSPEGAVKLRDLRTQLRTEVMSVQSAGSAPDLQAITETDQADTEEANVLAEQLADTERVFGELQDKYSLIESELEESQQSVHIKQLKLHSIERELVEISGKSDALELHLAQERSSRDRIEWLFVGFIAVLLVVMVFMS